MNRETNFVFSFTTVCLGQSKTRLSLLNITDSVGTDALRGMRWFLMVLVAKFN